MIIKEWGKVYMRLSQGDFSSYTFMLYKYSDIVQQTVFSLESML